MGSAVSSGVVVPMLLIGGAWGRLCGLLLNEMFGVHQEPGLQWLDPGAFALIGAAAFFGGVSRLTMSLTVIMMEITNDIHFLLPIMVAIMVAKLVADSSTHSLYHALIELKCIPFLDHQPSAPGGVSLELYSASDVMASPVITLPAVCPVRQLVRVLSTRSHSAFPVVGSSATSGIESSSARPHDRNSDELGGDRFLGMIMLDHLRALLCHEELFRPRGAHGVQRGEVRTPVLEYSVLARLEESSLSHGKLDVRPRTETDQLRVRAYKEQGARDRKSPLWSSLLQKLDTPEHENLEINLMPYVNTSSFVVPRTMSLERTYLIFRTMGLRHLPVVDEGNRPIGMLSKKVRLQRA